jgi:hypothetical protein
MARGRSQIFSILRGSVGGDTYLASTTHAIVVRARVSPVNRNTVYQRSIRAGFRTASGFWKNGNSALWDPWNVYASYLYKSGALGSYQMTGRQLFCGNVAMQQYAKSLGATYTSESHALASIPTGRLVAPSAVVSAPATGHTGFQVAITNNDTAQGVVLVQRSAPYSLSKNFFKGPFLASTFQRFDTAGAASHTFAFDVAPAGQQCWFRVLMLDKATGQLMANTLVGSATISTTP